MEDGDSLNTAGWRALARAVIGKAISDYLLPPISKERKGIRSEAEMFLFPNDPAWRARLQLFLNIAGIDSAWFMSEFSQRIKENRDTTLWSGAGWG